MKKNLIKKVFAVSLSIAMACSFLPAANPVTASAAAPYVSLKTTFKTLKISQSYTMTLKNNTINWKIRKVETTDKTIATVYGKTTSQVMIKGKSVGRATIRVRLATTKRKTNNTKTLRCRVNVISNATTPETPVTPVQTDAEVKTQAELDAALSNSSITKITINPTEAVNFVIPQGTYSNVDLIVDAPQSDIENSATFKSITINNIKPETWTEKATGNTFSILAKAARLVVDQAASVKNISIGTADSTVNVVINGGTVQGVNVTAKSTLNITGTAAENAALIPVTFGVAAADSVFTTELPVAVSMSANVELTFEKGAVKSTVKLEVTGIKAVITNNTAEAIIVTKNDNTPQSVPAGAQKSTVNATTGTTTPVTPGTSTTPGTTVNKGPALYTINTGCAFNISLASATVTGASVAVSGGSIDVVDDSLISIAIDGITTTGSAVTTTVPVVQYTIVASQIGERPWTKTVTTGDMKYDSETKSYSIIAENLSINGSTMGTQVIFNVSVRVKETDTAAASVSFSKVFTYTF